MKTKDNKFRQKLDLIIKIVLIIVIILLLIHNCQLIKNNKKDKPVPNGNVDIIDINCDNNQCKPTPTPNKGIIIPTEKDIISIDFTSKKVSITEGDTLKLITIIKPSELSSSKLNWVSSNPNIVTVDANGVIKGISEGNAIITVTTVNGKKTTCAVNVVKETVDVKEIKLSFEEKTINTGSVIQLIATVEPENATNRDLVWESSDNSIASVDSNGIIRGLKNGKVTITVKTKDGKVVAESTITVKDVMVEKINLDKTKMTLKTRKSSQIKATVIPSDAVNKELVWSSGDQTIATVDSNGVVKGIKPGKVTITVKTKDGKVKATCEVEIKANDVEEISLDKKNITLNVGKASQIKATIKPSDAENKELVWSSSDQTIATIDSNGVVKGIKPGKVTITVKTKDGKAKAICEVEVKPIDVKEIKLNPKTMSLKVDSSSQIVAVINPSDATYQDLVWSSSDQTIAKVDSNGKVTGIKPGKVTITAKTKDGKVKGTCEVNIVTNTVPVDNIKLNTNELSIRIGDDSQLLATIEPENATERDLVWSSSDQTIAKVDSNGKVTGLKVGKTTITVKTKDGKVKATCVVEVKPIDVEEIYLDTTEMDLIVRTSQQINATVLPDNATDKELIWSSSDQTIAVVDKNGKVTGIKEGIAIITAKSKDGKVKATCTVTVTVPLIDDEVNVYDRDYDPVNWNGSSDLKIFSKSIYDFDDIIAPESFNTYQFIVRNNTDYKIKYSVKFIESNEFNINIKYKLKKNNDYIYGEYSKANELIIEEYTLNPNENDTYYLDWKWISSNNDTSIGTNPAANYGLRIEVEAESVNE